MAATLPPSKRGGRGRPPMSEINVTPLVDVMLVLLIIFMVTAPLLVTGVPIRLPQSRAKVLNQDQKPTILSINGSGKIFINDDPVREANLPNRLFALKDQLAPDQQLYLRADSDLDYGTVMRIMGEINRAGLDRVALVTAGTGERSSSAGSVKDQ